LIGVKFNIFNSLLEILDDTLEDLLSQIESSYDYDDPNSTLEACIKLEEIGKDVNDIQTKLGIIDSFINCIKLKVCAATRSEAVRSLGQLESKKARLVL
jgi:hypothetical protein